MVRYTPAAPEAGKVVHGWACPASRTNQRAAHGCKRAVKKKRKLQLEPSPSGVAGCAGGGRTSLA